jgi:hypothetical protein
MKKRTLNAKLIVVGAVITSLTGCAAPDGSGPSNAAVQGAIGAGAGAIAGLVLCKAIGGSNVACRNAALLAGAAGAYIGWRHGKEQDLAQARALEQSLHSAGVPVVTDTVNLNKPDDSGKAQTVTAWKGTTVGLPKSMLASKSPDLQKSVELSGQLAASRSEPCRVLVSVPDADKAEVLAWLNSGMQAPGPNAKQAPEVKILAAKPGDIPFLRVEPVDQRQFGNAPLA